MGCGASKAIVPTVSTPQKPVEKLNRTALPSIPKSTAFEIPLDNQLPKLNLPPLDKASQKKVNKQIDELIVFVVN
jgi:hypothetical protein